MEDFILFLGDFNIPHQQIDIPSKFKEFIESDKVGTVLCTGNVCNQQTLKYLQELKSDLHIVRGDQDQVRDFPEIKLISVNGIKIVLIHGH